ncbi:MAG TPA: hypothetical protein VGR22_11465 [Thermomicrobiales bacterium]|nr:hypothetical protein [Thermomicrobiales bacterium]
MGGLILPHGIRAQGDNQLPQATEPAPTESDTAETAPAQTASQPQGDGTGGIRMSEGLLPDYRLLFYYGFPENELMGILGEYSPEENLQLLREQVAEYEAVDSTRPWKIGFELIASVAQGTPQGDNSYVADTDGDWLDLYTEFTAEHDMVLLLDVQMGRKEPKEDYQGLERWLRYDHVHLGIDPEFKMWGDEIPGQDLGHVTAEQVTEAQQWLVDVADKYGTSRKMLVVHQFHVYMIEDKDQIKPMAGVDLVIDEDGWGPPDMKMDTYEVVITQQPIEYHGIKLFYQQDDPLMTPAEVMALEPTPDVVIYQ